LFSNFRADGRQYYFVQPTSHADSLTVNQQRQRQTSVSQMTDGKDETWFPAEMSVARRRPWSVVADDDDGFDDADSDDTEAACVQVRSYSPRAASEPEPCVPTPSQFHVPPSNIAGDRRVPYSDGEYSLAHGRTSSPPPPAPPGMTDTMMDRAMQSSLPSLVGDQLNSLDARFVLTLSVLLYIPAWGRGTSFPPCPFTFPSFAPFYFFRWL